MVFVTLGVVEAKTGDKNSTSGQNGDCDTQKKVKVKLTRSKQRKQVPKVRVEKKKNAVKSVRK